MMLAWLASAWAGCLVVQGGSLWDGAQARPGDLVVVDGRIAGVGAVAGLTASGETATWQGRSCARTALPEGAIVTPGLVESWGTVGIVEVAGERSTVDSRGSGDPVRAALIVADAYNPRSVHVPVMRLGGVTSTVIVPSDGRIAGQAGWVRLAGATQADAVVERSVGMVGSLDGASVAESLGELRALIEDARAFASNAAAVEGNRFRAFAEGASRQDLIALGAVARGEIPLVVQADRASDLEALLRMAGELKVRLVIRGAAEGWLIADQLATAKVPVILDPYVAGPVSFDAVHGRADNAALLAAAGVEVVIAASPSHNAPTLPQVAGNAVRAGLPYAAALNAITRAPARVFGMDDRGALEVGAVADLVAFSADPLELSTDVLLVVIDGEVQPLVSRQTVLTERYRAVGE